MKVKLIVPQKGGEHELFDEQYLSFMYGVKKYGSIPLALPTLAGLTPPHVDVEIMDQNIVDIDYDAPVDLVGITFNTMLAKQAYSIADQFRARGVKVVLGGIHATVLPQEAKQHADAVVVGEAETTWPQVVADAQDHRLKEYYTPAGLADLDAAPPPRHDLVKSGDYITHVMQTTRGCPHSCEFCSVNTVYGRQYRYKSIDQVLAEVRQLVALEPKNIFFCDDNFISHRRRTRELLQRLAPLKINYTTQGDINIAKDDELLDLLAASGCRKYVVGFESINRNSLAGVNKAQVNDPDKYYEYVEKIQSRGIEILGGFVLGLDSDTENVFADTLEFVQVSGLAYVMLNILTPFPGTKIFQRFRQEGRILHYDWEKYDGTQVCYRPALMSAQALQEGFRWLYEQVYTYDAIFQRMNQLWMLWNESKSRTWGRLLPLVSNLEARDYAVKLRDAATDGWSAETSAPQPAGRLLAASSI